MIRTIATACTAALLLVGFLGEPVLAKKSLDELADEILQELQEFYPVRSTAMGIHTHDYKLADYSSGSVKSMRKKLIDFQQEIYRFRDANLSTDNRIRYSLLKANLDMALLDLDKIEWHKRSPQLYVDEAVNGLYYLMNSQHAPLAERLISIMGRMKAVPEFFETARKNVKKAPEMYIQAALESLDSGSDFYKQVAGSLMREFPDRADDILKTSTRAREAMNDFAAYLTAMERDDPTAFAIGKRNFDYMLTNGHLLEYDADSLLKIGEALFAEADQAYQDYKQVVVEEHQDGADSVFVPASFNRQDILDYYQWETEQVRLFCEMNDVVSVPAAIAPVKVVETPPFLQPMIAGIAYQPAGPFDSNQTGIFYVRPVPEDLSDGQLAARYRYVHRRGFRGSVVHEAYPGHHLQMQIAGMHPDPVRKWQENLLLIEGWALYSEEMMYDAGLFGDDDPTQWLGILGGIRFRAARIIADVKLHTGQWTYEECVSWMTEALDAETPSSQEYIRKEVRRYTMQPTVPMSYLIGKLEIEKMKEAVMARDGEEYSESDFHDELLAQGAIPPSLIRLALEL